MEREPNGYRVFTDRHVKQCMVLRLALQVEIVQNGLRRKAVETVKTSAACDYEGAITLIDEYIDMVRREHRNADEAVAIVKVILSEERGGDDEQQAGDGSG
ncbi:MAG: MerR family transcriptional regulator, partial [Lentihominibacter sp.]|nr:MerR family transcriptional regulator [Lentihominibacter sp.]